MSINVVGTRWFKQGEFIANDILAQGNPAPAIVKPDAAYGLLVRFSKSKRASERATAFGGVGAIYGNAIAIIGAANSAQMRGVGLVSACVIVAILSFAFPWVLQDMYREFFFRDTNWFGVLMDLLMCWVGWRFGIKMLPVLWRMDMFSAESQPTIFDRKHRKIYRLFEPLDGSARRGAWRGKPMPLYGAEYEWDCVSAEHRVELITRGNSVARIHRLILVVRERPQAGETYGRLIEEIEIGNALALGPDTVPALWEHLRRFMEEGGPPVPAGEPLQVFERPRTLWQSLGVVSPFGPRFVWWWRTNRAMTVFALMTAPFSLPFSLLWAVCNWISHKTMRATVWPDEIFQRIGKPLQET